MTVTPNMLLDLPVVGTTVGPAYATLIDAALTKVDAHDHTNGNGVPITPDGIDITSDLPFASNNATGLRSTRYTSLSAVLSAASDLNCAYVKDGNLYFRDSAGNNVQITLAGNVNTSSSGSITGMGATTATASYSDISKIFTFLQATATPAGIAGGPFLLSPAAANTYRIAITAPTLAADYDLTLPATPPASTSILLMSSAGTISATLTPTITSLAATTLTASTSIAVGSSTATYASASPSIARLVLDTALQVVSASTGILKKFSSSTRTLEIADSSTGTARPIVVCYPPTTHGLLILRGTCNGTTANVITGEGWGAARNSLGNYTVTFTSAFTDAPAVTVLLAGYGFVRYNSISATTFNIEVSNTALSNNQDVNFSFIAVGQRGV